MSLTIVTGPAQAGKTQACIKTLACDAPPEIILVCATTYLSDSLGRRLALRQQQGTVAPGASDTGDVEGAEALSDFLLRPPLTTTTFRDLTEKLWGLYGDERAFIGQAARETLVEELLADVDQGGHFESLQTAGGRRFLTEVIQACASSSARDFQGQLSALLASLITSYNARLQERGLIEPDAALLDLAERGVFADATYGFLGFTDFPPAQRAYVRMLTARTGVAIAVTCEPSGEAAREGRRFAADLAAEHWGQTGEATAHVQVGVEPSDRAESELCALRVDFLHDDAPDSGLPLDGEDSAVRFVVAQGEDEEIQASVQAVITALNTSSLQCKIAALPTDDAPVALIFRHLGSKIGRIAQALDAAGVSAAFDLKVPFRQAGLGAALCALLRLPFAGDEVATAASGYLLSAYSGATQAEAAEVERVLREREPGYSEWLCGKLGVPDLRSLTAEAWAQLATDLLFRAARVKRNDYLRQLDFAAHKLFLAQLAEQRELALSAGSAAGTQPAAGAADSPALDPRKILAGLQSAQINLTPAPGSTQALVSEAPRVRGRQFHTVILAGLAQQDFPAAIEPSLAEYTVAQITGHAEPDKLVGEHQLWYDLLGCAREALVLIGQDRDLSGQELAPSALLEELRARYGIEEQAQERGHGGARPGAVAVSGRGAPGASRPTSESGATIQCTGQNKGSVVDQCQEQGEVDASAGRSEQGGDAIALGAPERGAASGFGFGSHAVAPFAVTTLERYARCPYAWFLNAFVARRRVRGAVDAINEGLILHATLERFYRLAAHELGEAHVRHATLGRATQLLDRCFDEAWRERLDVDSATQLPEGTQVSLEALREALHGFLAHEVDWLPGFTPRYFELPFGADESVPAPTVGGVAIRGIIDRIDTYEPLEAEAEAEAARVATPEAAANPAREGLFFIIDYKRRGLANGGQLRARVGHKEIQATVYGLVAAQLLAPLRYAGSAYRNILSPQDLKVEHPASLRKRYWEQLGFPEKSNLTPQAIPDRPKKDQPSQYESGIAGIEDIVAAAARGLSAGDATLAAPRNSKGEETERCLFTRDCLHRACPYYHKDVWL